MPSALDLTLEMVRFASVTNSSGEHEFAAFLKNRIAQEAHFQAHPDDVWLEPIHTDPFGRSNVLALVRGQGKKTTVLTGHYDVVSVANYGALEPYAFEPLVLREKLIADLVANANSQAEKLALADLVSGLFLPGRGMLDMKSGLAAGLVALLRFAAQPERFGNLLFLAVADEEVQSHGARGAVAQLPRICQEHNLEISAIINLDATSDDTDGRLGQAVYTGSVGKFLVSGYVAGIDTHAGYPLAGINPNFLLSEVVRLLECNPALADVAHGEAAPPPTTLKQADLKTHYDVTTPGRAYGLWNVLTHGKPAQAVLAEFKAQTQAALETAMQTLRERAVQWGKHESAALEVRVPAALEVRVPAALEVRVPAALEVQPFVLSYAELLEQAKANSPDFAARLAAFIAELEPHQDVPTQSQRIVDFVWAQSGLIGPAVVLGFASLHYPAVLLEAHDHTWQVISRTLKSASAELGVQVQERKFFAGISDMSWFGAAPDFDLEFLGSNTPLPSARVQGAPLGLPTINLGPWGRDYHQWLERVHVPYSFEVLPELVWRVALAVLKTGA
jgi:arginine utilization protein RocB